MGNVEEIKELIKNDIVKEKTVSTLASKYDISELEVIGIIKKLKDDGVNISYYEKNQDEFIKYVYDKTREGEHETNEFEKMLNNMNERLGINRGTVEENNTHKTTK